MQDNTVPDNRCGNECFEVQFTHIHRPGAHGAVGAAKKAAPTFGPKMGVSNIWACLMS